MYVCLFVVIVFGKTVSKVLRETEEENEKA